MRTAGPRAGLRAFRAVVDRVSATERGRAILFGLDCATALGDRRGLDEMIARWRVQGGDHFAAICRRCLALRSVSMPHALRLAEVESARRPDDARAHYLLGRLRGPDGGADLRRALQLAERPPRQSAIAGAARDRLSWLGHAPEGFDRGERSTSARLGKARADLRRGGRYARVAALDVLVELADGPAKGQALAMAAAHAERAELTAIELDRLRTLLSNELPAAQRAAAIDWLDAREALDAGEAPSAGGVPGVADAAFAARAALERGAVMEEGVRGAALAVIAAMSEGPAAVTEAAHAFALQAEAIPVAAEPYLAAAAQAARANAGAGEAIADRLLVLPAAARRGWLRLAKVLRDPERREAVLERARAVGERGADELLGQVLRDAAWRALKAGDEGEAAEKLARARQLLR